MGIESTKTVRRSEAIRRIAQAISEKFIKESGIKYMENEKLSDLMYEYRDTEFENYRVVNDEDWNDKENY